MYWALIRKKTRDYFIPRIASILQLWRCVIKYVPCCFCARKRRLGPNKIERFWIIMYDRCALFSIPKNGFLMVIPFPNDAFELIKFCLLFHVRVQTNASNQPRCWRQQRRWQASKQSVVFALGAYEMKSLFPLFTIRVSYPQWNSIYKLYSAVFVAYRIRVHNACPDAILPTV